MSRSRARANGEGSIFPYRNGFAAYAWVITPAGGRRRKYVYGPTREVVHAKWVKLQDEAARRPVATRVPTLAEYLTDWLRDVVEPNLAPLTAATYETLVRLYLVRAWARSGSIDSASATCSGGSTAFGRRASAAFRPRTPAVNPSGGGAAQ